MQAASLSTYTPGNKMMEKLNAKGAASQSEVSQAHAKFLERGQKLNELEDRTEAMANEAEQYANNAKMLLNKTKDKKWYQW